MTYYGYRVRFRFTFACGCSGTKGPIYQKFAYQFAGLGARQKCPKHRGVEVERVVEKIDGPHGDHALGVWKRSDASKVFLTWRRADGWVTVAVMEGRYPRDWPRERLVNIPDEAVIRRLLGGDWGGERAGPAERILDRFRAAGKHGSVAVESER